MLLALRGWGREEFELASREFLSEVRFGLFAEMAGRWLLEAKFKAFPVDTRNMTHQAAAEAIKGQLAAQSEVKRLRAALGLDDG